MAVTATVSNRFNRWFQLVWRHRIRWRQVAREYQQLRDLEHVLADIALRGSIGTTTHDRDPHVAAFNEGRRSLALEIGELARADLQTLIRMIETPLPMSRTQGASE
jgi:hypothetical protein